MYDLLPARGALSPAGRCQLRAGRARRRCIAGYLVHRWLTGTVPRATRLAARARDRLSDRLDRRRAGAGAFGRRHPRRRSFRWRPRSSSRPRPIARAGAGARAANRAAPVAAVGLIAAFMAVDLAWNNAPAQLDRAAAGAFRRAAPGHQQRDRAAAQVAARRCGGARPARPRRADRHRLSLAEPLAGAGLRSRVRAQSAAAALVQARRPMSATPSLSRPARLFAALSVLPLGLRRSARRALHRHRRAGRADRLLAQARRSQSHRTYQGRLCLRESARAAAGDAARRTGGSPISTSSCSGGWPGVDPRRTVLLEEGAGRLLAQRCRSAWRGSARLLRYANTEVVVEVEAPGRRHPAAQRRLASLVARERRRHRGRDLRPM